MRLARDERGYGLVVEDRFTLLASIGLDHEAGSNEIFESWSGVVDAIAGLSADEVALHSEPLNLERLEAPIGSPRQVFALALNYSDHAAEAGVEPPEHPLVFPKYPSCLVGPHSDVVLGSNRVDWEVELVAVVGRGGYAIPESEGWAAIAGLTIGQDISDRRIQARPPIPHFALAKSGPTYGPVGPVVVTVDEFQDPDDLEIWCEINGERVQSSRTGQLIFSLSRIVAEISAHVALQPGDLIFTGTPAGVGASRDPRRYLAPGDEIVSAVEGIGAMRNHCKSER